MDLSVMKTKVEGGMYSSWNELMVRQKHTYAVCFLYGMGSLTGTWCAGAGCVLCAHQLQGHCKPR